MRRPFRRPRISSSRASAVAAGLALLISTSSWIAPTVAHADDPRADLVAVSAGDLWVSTPNCKYVPVNVQWSVDPSWTLSSAYADVYKGSAVVGSQSLTKNDTYLWCPYADGVGTFRFGPGTQVVAYDADYNQALFTDDTTGTLSAKLGSTVAISLRWAGSTLTATAWTKRYDISTNTFLPWRSPSTVLQAWDGTRWTYVGTLRQVVFGVVRWIGTQAPGRTYRVVTNPDAFVWGRASISATPRRVAAARAVPVPRRAPAPAPTPGAATAVCRDGTLSYSQHRSGSCSHHGGVLRWL